LRSLTPARRKIFFLFAVAGPGGTATAVAQSHNSATVGASRNTIESHYPDPRQADDAAQPRGSPSMSEGAGSLYYLITLQIKDHRGNSLLEDPVIT